LRKIGNLGQAPVSAKRGADWTSSIRGVVESKRRQFDLDNTGAELAEPVNGLVERWVVAV
jgi:hypothetical protein